MYVPNSKKITGECWRDCDRCGLTYRLSQLKRQDGYWLCREMCVDIPGRDYHLKKLEVKGELRGAEQEESKSETFSDGD